MKAKVVYVPEAVGDGRPTSGKYVPQANITLASGEIALVIDALMDRDGDDSQVVRRRAAQALRMALEANGDEISHGL